MSDFFTGAALLATFASGIRLAIPYLLAALGETIGQRSGVLNLGVDGIMLLGGFWAYWTVLHTGSQWRGMLVALGVGLLLGALAALINVVLRAEQGISGIGLYLVGLGGSDLLFQELVGTPLPIRGFGDVPFGPLVDIPVIGELLFQHGPAVYLALALVPIVWFVLNRTHIGTRITAVGENPAAADSVGLRVGSIRFCAVTVGGGFAGVAGAVLTIQLGIFQQNLTNGIGFIAVALVYFGAWRPVGVLLGALLYGLVAATVLQLKALGVIPREVADLAAMAPAVLTILALVIGARTSRAPAALTVPFARGHV
jgi:general nucleoside transport system permease protein